MDMALQKRIGSPYMQGATDTFDKSSNAASCGHYTNLLSIACKGVKFRIPRRRDRPPAGKKRLG
jgi:hypothetical protein